MRYNGGICTILLYFTVCFFRANPKTATANTVKNRKSFSDSRLLLHTYFTFGKLAFYYISVRAFYGFSVLIILDILPAEILLITVATLI